MIEIQGITRQTSNEDQHFSYSDMVEQGIAVMGAKPLSIWERLRRQPALVGEVKASENHCIVLEFWTRPKIDLIFDLASDEEAALWRECEIMALSGGFHFRIDPSLQQEQGSA